jgi:O-acetyl-ADP-ribose deacetylase (regulator of RNase III)
MIPTIIDGDLLDQKVDVIVNPWNRNVIPWFLLLPQGVSGAIKRRGGFRLFHDLMLKGPLPLGAATMTGAGKLPYKAIIHVAGIDMLWRASRASIRDSVLHAMALVNSHGYGSVAFPVIGAGSGGFPPGEALAVMLAAFDRLETPAAVTVVKYAKKR